MCVHVVAETRWSMHLLVASLVYSNFYGAWALFNYTNESWWNMYYSHIGPHYL